MVRTRPRAHYVSKGILSLFFFFVFPPFSPFLFPNFLFVFFKDGKVVKHQSLPQALIELFPEIRLDASKFPSKSTFLPFFLVLFFINFVIVYFIFPSTGPCDKIENRRNFFIEYANTHGFDPLNPDHWYLQSREKLIAVKESFLLFFLCILVLIFPFPPFFNYFLLFHKKKARRILPYHSHSITTALLELFPNIGLDRSKFLPQKGNFIQIKIDKN